MGGQSLSRQQDKVTALQALTTTAKSTGQRDEYLKDLRRLTELQPNDVTTLAALATELADRYDYDQAQPVIARLLKLDPNYAPAYLLRGQLYFTEATTPQDLARAVADFQQVLQLNSQDMEAHRYLGRIYMRQGQPRQAIAQYEAISRARPYVSAHFWELANAYRQLGDTQQADALQRRFTTLKALNLRMQDLKDRTAHDPTNFDNNLALGLLLLQCVEADADSYNLYRYRYAKKQLNAPAFYLSQALALRPYEARARNAMSQLETAYTRYLQLGQQALQRHDLSHAKSALAHAFLLMPGDPRTNQAAQQAALAGVFMNDELSAAPDATPATLGQG